MLSNEHVIYSVSGAVVQHGHTKNTTYHIFVEYTAPEKIYCSEIRGQSPY
jgi:hypothetical protein